MIINQPLLDTLCAQAKSSPRLRQAYDLRNCADDTSQRMLNALDSGTVVPSHRHNIQANYSSCPYVDGAEDPVMCDLVEIQNINKDKQNIV